jgi:hypothetical protein
VTPSWLYYLFSVLMLGVAAYCLVMTVLSVATNRPAGRDVDISHACMGVSMAGMFVAGWAFGPDAMWELVFAALLVWFVVRSIQSLLRFGLHLPHASIHAVMSFSMLLMYWFPMGASSAGGSMAMSSTGPKLDSGVAFVLAFVLLVSAVFTLASPNKGASHFGMHAPAYAMVGSPGPALHAHPDDGTSPTIALEELVATPWLVDASHVVMCIAMGFLLILMT